MNMARARFGMALAQGALLVCLLMPSIVLADTVPLTSTSAPVTATATQAANGTGDFVPLTHFPQITALADQNGFAGFVNTVYKVCIGAGAVLAVIMIMVAGVEFMRSTGSVASNQKAKAHIQNAILGLVLVLAPTIVFGIINPDILNLNLGTEFTQLKQDKAIDQDAFKDPVSGPSATSTDSYLLSAYVVYTNTSSKASCYSSLVKSFTTQASCNTIKEAIPATFGEKDGWTKGNVVFVKSCEVGDASRLSLTVPNNVPACTN